jgi:sialic acid synthase SpsE
VGIGTRQVLPCERDVRHVSRQSLALRRPLSAGKTIEYGDLTTRRPGDGLPPAKLDQVVGRTLLADRPAGHVLTATDFAVPATRVA